MTVVPDEAPVYEFRRAAGGRLADRVVVAAADRTIQAAQ